MARTTTKAASIRKNGFLVVGNQLALDFLNTRPVQNGEAMELLPDFAALLGWFQTPGLMSPREGFREKLRKEVLEWEQGHTVLRSTIDEVNRLMVGTRCPPVRRVDELRVCMGNRVIRSEWPAHMRLAAFLE